jgi:hypothetical protein
MVRIPLKHFPPSILAVHQNAIVAEHNKADERYVNGFTPRPQGLGSWVEFSSSPGAHRIDHRSMQVDINVTHRRFRSKPI